MTTAATVPTHAPRAEIAITRSAAIAWPLHAVLFSSACILVGLIWDISWHSTIGRDTFWSPPHLLEQLGAIVSGLSCGWLVLRTTFAGTPEQRGASVKFWGFRGPFGAWVTIWGTFVMITSAPFDNWWHNAYGLDVRIISPPHVVLGLGMLAIALGAMLMVLAAQNRATEPAEVQRLGWAYALASGLIVGLVGTFVTEYSSRPNDMHNVLFYTVAGGVFPLFLVAFARSGRLRFPATTTAGLYMAIILAMMWMLQLFPAQPKLAPIYNAVTHMVPPEFPLLLIVPAFGMDLLLQRAGRRHDWLVAVALGASFVVLLAALQWFFGEFLLSPAARNFVFAADQWAYMVRPGDWRYEFWEVPTDAAGNLSLPLLAKGLGFAALLAAASARIGLWWGNGMSRVMR